ncbi:SRPBCC family protein [Flagellimonas myxillae]|uniref:SRPBCC family protein n=1 Tax=Flagellimonas myxillae TaxID=2942214 RepID=UPI00201F946F|nr:SRPBCC family protein [Muricauda myxillae]MCL6266172.1 SRPBCC family protein [Muricauda myxillae]
MHLYKLHTKQYLPISIMEAWEFLSNPKNLPNITPKHMEFSIISGGDRLMYPGQIIAYTVKPFPGYAVRWVTEITHMEDGYYFVDEQRHGPYAFWHHKHFLKEHGNGVIMEDIVDYALPYGILGRLAHTLFVKRQLNKIFEHRRVQLETIFGTPQTEDHYLVLKTV